ncbi:MAG: ABC transporter permease [Chloroflexi bacterium]|nr:ABC transporter permease [Chloroflexota bacterium]
MSSTIRREPHEPGPLPATPRPRGRRRASSGRLQLLDELRDGLVLTERNLRQIPRVPELLVFSTIQPVIFVLLFSFVFGSAIPLPGGGNYREFLMAGIFTQTVAFSTGSTAVGLAEDLSKGLVDRFRSLPMARSAVLVGRTVADLFRTLFVVLVMGICGFLVGWRIHGGLPAALAAGALLLLFGFAMSWVGAWIGLSVPNPEVANTAGFIWLFPLTFLSNAFVPAQGMPTWLQKVVEWNPVTATVTACRELFGNPNPFVNVDSLPGRHPVVMSLSYSLLVLVVFVPLAVRKYRSASSR